MLRNRDMQTREDDGHSIADMSGVGSGLSEARGVLGGMLHRDGVAHGAADALSTSSRDFAEELQGPEERLMVILGTLKAALGIGMVYVLGFGIAIAMMVMLWT